MLNSSINSDLVWQLSGFQYPEKAVNFLKQFESSFCVFSKNLRHLYSNYELLRFGQNVVTLPNPYAYHDTFFNIPDTAVKATAFLVVPANSSTLNGWRLAFKNKGRWVKIDLKLGLQKLQNVYGADDPLLPIIINSNLREYPKRQSPIMQLHRISVKALQCMSPLDAQSIRRTISDKIFRS